MLHLPSMPNMPPRTMAEPKRCVISETRNRLSARHALPLPLNQKMPITDDLPPICWNEAIPMLAKSLPLLIAGRKRRAQ